jgi:hypothetical protein
MPNGLVISTPYTGSNKKISARAGLAERMPCGIVRKKTLWVKQKTTATIVEWENLAPQSMRKKYREH